MASFHCNSSTMYPQTRDVTVRVHGWFGRVLSPSEHPHRGSWMFRRVPDDHRHFPG